MIGTCFLTRDSEKYESITLLHLLGSVHAATQRRTVFRKNIEWTSGSPLAYPERLGQFVVHLQPPRRLQGRGRLPMPYCAAENFKMAQQTWLRGIHAV